MVDSQKVAVSTIRVVKQLGQFGRHFQSQDVRKELGYSEQDEEAHYMHNVIARLKKQGLIKTVGGTKSRKRNQYLVVADDAGLRARLEKRQSNGAKASTTDGSAPGPAAQGDQRRGPPRVVYLEERVAQLEEVVAKFDPRDIADIKERLSAVDQKVTELVDMWS